MKALALTFSGMTDLCAQEIRQLIGVSGKETAEGVLFDAEREDIFAVCYRAQSIARVILVLSEGSFDKLSVPNEYLAGTIKRAPVIMRRTGFEWLHTYLYAGQYYHGRLRRHRVGNATLRFLVTIITKRHV